MEIIRWRLLRFVLLYGFLQISLTAVTDRKILVTRIRFGVVPNELQHNATAFLEKDTALSGSSVNGSQKVQTHFNGDNVSNVGSPHRNTTKHTGYPTINGRKPLNAIKQVHGKTSNTQEEDFKDRKSKLHAWQPGKVQDRPTYLRKNTDGDEIKGHDDVTESGGSSGDVDSGDDSRESSKIISNPDFQPKIVGGSQSFPNGWPSEASIQYLGSDGYWYHFCGGSLIHEQWVVTVAHCLVELEDMIIRIVLGDYRLGSMDGREQIAAPINIFVHAYFNHPEWSYDIGLIKLQYPVILNSYVQIAVMATEHFEPFTEDHECYVAGWGSIVGTDEGLVTPDYLQQSQMTVITKQACRRELQVRDALTDSHICIENSKASICIGDSGSPLQCRVDEHWVLAGLASWIRDDGCEPSVPNVFTRISSVYSWCEGVMKQY